MIAKALSVLLFVGVAAAQYNYKQPPTSPPNKYLPPSKGFGESAAQPIAPAAEHEPGNPYDFTYSVKEEGIDSSHNAKSDGDVVKGEYRTLLPDGRTQIVRYTADWKNGYNAEVIYEGEATYPEPKPKAPRPAPKQNYESDRNIDSQAGYPKNIPRVPQPPRRPQPAPKAPTNLYDTPTQSFGARNNPKFGYSK